MVLTWGVLAAVVLSIAAYSLYSLLKRRSLAHRGKRCGKIIPPIRELLQNPDQIQVNLRSLHAPPISGYSLKILTYLYYTTIGRFIVTHSILSRSNLDLFSGCVIPETPTLKYSPPLPTFPERDASKTESKDFNNQSELLSLMKSHTHLRYEKESFCFNGVDDFYMAFKSSTLTPTDVAHAVLAAIEDSNAGDVPLRAIVASNRESVMSMAEASTERWRSGTQLSLLDGVPISIKEDFCSDLYPCYCGLNSIPEFIKNQPESNVVRKLCNAGAVIIGITNMPELGSNSIGKSENSTHKQPRNPYNTDFFPGGSSSGAGASVAAGLCPISIAADGGGSGRVPAAVCGSYGLKVTANLLHEIGSFGSMFSFSELCPISSSPLDIAILMDVLCNLEFKSDEIKMSSIPFVLSNAGNTLSGLTIGVYWDWIEAADSETGQKFYDVIEKLKLLGAKDGGGDQDPRIGRDSSCSCYHSS